MEDEEKTMEELGAEVVDLNGASPYPDARDEAKRKIEKSRREAKR